MKTTPQIHLPIGSSRARLLFLATLPAIAAVSSAAAPDAAKTELKPYTLFIGADFAVQQNKDSYRIQDVDGGSFVIKVNGEQVLVPMDKESVSLKIEQSLKLTGTSASVANLKSERAYTPANDPRRKWASMGNAPVDIGNATRNMVGTQEAASRWDVQSSNPNPLMRPSGPRPDDVAAAKNFEAAARGSESDMNNAGYNTGTMEEELAKGLFDAMEVTFEVSAEQPLTSPYMVVLAQYHERDTPPGTSRNWIYAKALEPIDSKPRKVRIQQGGFPPGFELEKFQVHLYNRGQELATNVADKRVPLTRDEAFQYVLIDYVSSHKGASLPATPAMGKLPADLRTRLDSGQLTQRFFVKVSKDGLPVETYVDESCSHKVDDPYLLSVIRDLRFNPALEKGRPVEGTALLKLGDLRL